MIKELVLTAAMASKTIIPEYGAKIESPMDNLTVKIMENAVQSQNYGAAINAANNLKINDPKNPAGYFYAGFLKFKQNDMINARKEFEASNFFKKDSLTHFYLAETYLDQCLEENTNCKLAEENYIQAYKTNMEQTTALLRLQVLTAKKGRTEESKNYKKLYDILRPKH